MNTMQKAFRSLQPEVLSAKPLAEVTKWLETLVNLVVPGNGIEYWSEGDLFDSNKVTLAEMKSKIPGLATVACFVHAGACEGRRIEFALCSATEIRRVARAKSFGSVAECWAIAGLVADALECVILNDREPRLVDMAYTVPRRYCYALAQPSVSALALRTEEDAVVTLADGREIERRPVDRTYGDHEVDALEHDWKLIASSFGLPITCERCAAPALDIGALP
jgi:hypothetical protein